MNKRVAGTIIAVITIICFVLYWGFSFNADYDQELVVLYILFPFVTISIHVYLLSHLPKFTKYFTTLFYLVLFIMTAVYVQERLYFSYVFSAFIVFCIVSIVFTLFAWLGRQHKGLNGVITFVQGVLSSIILFSVVLLSNW